MAPPTQAHWYSQILAGTANDIKIFPFPGKNSAISDIDYTLPLETLQLFE
jgi:hypothetical protein